MRSFNEAVDYYENALLIQHSIEDKWHEGNTLIDLGIALRQLTRLEEAVTVLRHAITVHDESSDQWGKAIALTTLGDTLHDNDQLDAARTHWRQALSIFEKLGARQAVEIRVRLKIPEAEKIRRPQLKVPDDAVALTECGHG